MNDGHHIELGRLGPDQDLTAEEQAHLVRCPRCRVEARLVARSAEVELPAAELATLQASLQQSMRSELWVTMAGGGPKTAEAGADPDALPGLGRYALVGRMAGDRLGGLLRVRDRELDRVVLLRVATAPTAANPEATERFLSEAVTLARLAHPAIPPVHDVGELPDGRPWFTRGELEGDSLNAWIPRVLAESSGRRGPTEAWVPTFGALLDALKRVCLAVEFAHRRGICHRNLKPTKILIGGHGEVWVDGWELAATLGTPGGLVGTPAFMPPERASNPEALLDERSDVYSLGAVLYALLSGRLPYEGPSPEDVLALVREGPPPPPFPSAKKLAAGALAPPTALVETCLAAMARAPADRHPSARALAHDLERWVEGGARD